MYACDNELDESTNIVATHVCDADGPTGVAEAQTLGSGARVQTT